MSNNNWHERFKSMKRGMKYTNADIAKIIGNTESSVKSTTQPNKSLPRWLKLAIVVYEHFTAYPQEAEFLGNIDDESKAVYKIKPNKHT